MESDRELIFALYEDDGPEGYCAQSCSVMSARKHLYIFDSMNDFKDFLKRIERRTIFKGRKNPRVTAYWVIDGYDNTGIIDKTYSQIINKYVSGES